MMAFAAAELAPRRQEWSRSDERSPEYVRRYGSPTILTLIVSPGTYALAPVKKFFIRRGQTSGEMRPAMSRFDLDQKASCSIRVT